MSTNFSRAVGAAPTSSAPVCALGAGWPGPGFKAQAPLCAAALNSDIAAMGPSSNFSDATAEKPKRNSLVSTASTVPTTWRQPILPRPQNKEESKGTTGDPEQTNSAAPRAPHNMSSLSLLAAMSAASAPVQLQQEAKVATAGKSEGNPKNKVIEKGGCTMKPSNAASPHPINSSQLILDSVKALSFPAKLHAILSRTDFADIVSWMPHGRAWRIHDPKLFETRVIPRFFVQCKYSSFIRQANGWGFRRITKGPDKNAYYNEHFLRGRPHLCQQMRRPATSNKPASDPKNEPDFYRMSAIDPLPEVGAPVLEAEKSHDKVSSVSADVVHVQQASVKTPTKAPFIMTRTMQRQRLAPILPKGSVLNEQRSKPPAAQVASAAASKPAARLKADADADASSPVRQQRVLPQAHCVAQEQEQQEQKPIESAVCYLVKQSGVSPVPKTAAMMPVQERLQRQAYAVTTTSSSVTSTAPPGTSGAESSREASLLAAPAAAAEESSMHHQQYERSLLNEWMHEREYIKALEEQRQLTTNGFDRTSSAHSSSASFMALRAYATSKKSHVASGFPASSLGERRPFQGDLVPAAQAAAALEEEKRTAMLKAWARAGKARRELAQFASLRPICGAGAAGPCHNVAQSAMLQELRKTHLAAEGLDAQASGEDRDLSQPTALEEPYEMCPAVNKVGVRAAGVHQNFSRGMALHDLREMGHAANRSDEDSLDMYGSYKLSLLQQEKMLQHCRLAATGAGGRMGDFGAGASAAISKCLIPSSAQGQSPVRLTGRDSIMASAGLPGDDLGVLQPDELLELQEYRRARRAGLSAVAAGVAVASARSHVSVETVAPSVTSRFSTRLDRTPLPDESARRRFPFR